MGSEPEHYEMRISRLTIDKLGVKLYDKASAVVAELIANAYDADATQATVEVPLGTELALKSHHGDTVDKGHEVVVRDDGHGMTPAEAQTYFLVVGTDRRDRKTDGAKSREKERPVMGRKGIGKLAPFGICRRIEVLSAGGRRTRRGYRVSHFVMDFDKIVKDAETAVPLESGSLDKTWRKTRGTEVRLSNFLPKRVPVRDVFMRQVARRFAFASTDFSMLVHDSRTGHDIAVPKFEIALNEPTKITIDDRPVLLGDARLPVTGWVAFAKESYRDEEEAGVRVYARGKIVATTRDFEQPAGFTGEYTTRSYLVGEVHAEWLDADDDEDLVRTDRQGILWDSDKGDAFRLWGMALIREIGAASKKPRRKKKSEQFLERSRLEQRARDRYGDAAVVDAVVELGRQIGAFASEDELDDPEYVEELADVVLAVAPHQALINAFREISGQQDKSVDELLSLFGKTRIAEMASYAQIASERVQSVQELQRVIDDVEVEEADLQNLVSRAPWLLQADWSVITDNQQLKTFRDRFVRFWKKRYGGDLEVAISYETKRPDFTLVHIGRELRIAELKKPGHAFADADYKRLENYVVAFTDFFAQNSGLVAAFPDGWRIDLVADSERIRDQTRRLAYDAQKVSGRVVRHSWNDFLGHAVTSLQEFLDAYDRTHGRAS